MNATSPLGLLGICIAFAVTAFLGGMAGSLLLGGNDNTGASTTLAQATVVGTPRPGGTPGAAGTVVAGTPGAAASAVVVPTQPPPPPPTNTPAPPTATPAPATYTVVSGDSLSIIAGKQNVPQDQRTAWIAQVQSLNNMTATSVLQIGQVLKLPPAAGGAAPSGTAAAGATATRPAGTPAVAPAATATKVP